MYSLKFYILNKEVRTNNQLTSKYYLWEAKIILLKKNVFYHKCLKRLCLESQNYSILLEKWKVTK